MEKSLVSKIFFIATTPGERTLRIRLQYRFESGRDFYDHEIVEQIPVNAAFETEFEVYSVPVTEENILPGTVKLTETIRFAMLAKIKSLSPWELELESIDFELKSHEIYQLRLISSSTLPLVDGGLGFKRQIMLPNQQYHVNFLFEVVSNEISTNPDSFEPGKLSVTWRRFLF